jgi:hypothetical protein
MKTNNKYIYELYIERKSWAMILCKQNMKIGLSTFGTVENEFGSDERENGT